MCIRDRVQAPFLPRQFVAALFDLFVGLGLHLQRGVLGLYQGLFPLLLRCFHCVIDKALCFFFRAADLLFGHLFPVGDAREETSHTADDQRHKGTDDRK